MSAVDSMRFAGTDGVHYDGSWALEPLSVACFIRAHVWVDSFFLKWLLLGPVRTVQRVWCPPPPLHTLHPWPTFICRAL